MANKISESIEFVGELNSKEKLDSDKLSELLQKSTSEISKAKAISKAKDKIDKEIENRAIKLSNKRGIDQSLARLKVLEKDPELYKRYKEISQKAQGLTAQELYNSS